MHHTANCDLILHWWWWAVAILIKDARPTFFAIAAAKVKIDHFWQNANSVPSLGDSLNLSAFLRDIIEFCLLQCLWNPCKTLAFLKIRMSNRSHKFCDLWKNMGLWLQYGNESKNQLSSSKGYSLMLKPYLKRCSMLLRTKIQSFQWMGDGNAKCTHIWLCNL